MKTQTITIRVGALEKLRIEQEAQKREMNVSEYIRYLIRRAEELQFQLDYERTVKALDDEFGKVEE